MYVVWRKLNRLQPLLRGLNRKVTTGVQKIQDSRVQLAQAHQLLAGDMFNQDYLHSVKHLSNELVSTIELEKQILLQNRRRPS